jgi:hypothetical protein
LSSVRWTCTSVHLHRPRSCAFNGRAPSHAPYEPAWSLCIVRWCLASSYRPTFATRADDDHDCHAAHDCRVRSPLAQDYSNIRRPRAPTHAAAVALLYSRGEPLDKERQDLVTGGDRRLTGFVDQVGCDHTVRGRDILREERRRVGVGGAVGEHACDESLAERL